jgi:hypothetical protein
MRQVEAENVQLHPHAADDADAFAEVDLSVARRKSERHVSLARLRSRQPHIILHDGIAAAIGVRELKSFENPLRRMPLLGRSRFVALRIASITGTNGPSRSNIPRRRRISAHLGDRIPA